MNPRRKPQRLCRNFYSLLGLGFWLMAVQYPSQVQAQPWALAQANIPSAGTILGWELNMNRFYTPRLDPGLKAPPNQAEPEAPVIFYDLKKGPLIPSPQASPYLLNAPGSQK